MMGGKREEGSTVEGPLKLHVPGSYLPQSVPVHITRIYLSSLVNSPVVEYHPMTLCIASKNELKATLIIVLYKYVFGRT